MLVDEVIENKEIAKQYKKLLKISYRTLTKEDKKLIRSAFDIAVDAHKNQRRKSGEAYVFHPIEVAKIAPQGDPRIQFSSFKLLHDVLDSFAKKLSIQLKINEIDIEVDFWTH